MPICKYCGDEIEFRYVDGQSTPIHINGGWCTGYSSSSTTRSTGQFGSVLSYVNPNAHCPVCGDKVYFYQSPFGGRVFFDHLAWPWPKHPCTDNPRAQSATVKRLSETSHKTFRASSGHSLELYELTGLVEQGDSVLLTLSRVNQRLIVLRLTVPTQLLAETDITLKDLRSAPSFVVRFYDDHRLLEFISGRKRKIVALKVPRI